MEKENDPVGRSADLSLARAVRDSKAPAIARAAAVMRLLGKSETPLGLQGISGALGLVPSTCLYVLRALVAEELVSFDPDTKRYALEVGVLTLARQWLRRNQFSDLAQAVLDRIGQAFDVTMLGVQIVGLEHIIVVATSRTGRNFQFSAQVGDRFPALISATGRCIAAFGAYPERELERRFKSLRWDDAPSLEAWREQVAQTRAQGFAVDEGNYISGMTVIAAPVWKGRDRPSHALVAISIGSALKRSGLPELQDMLVSSAATISRQLSG
ncbi:IclR family transcriptional regulator C-terminal domain-containing protein [Sphingomonas sp. BIUV-7]|uniref:IclR family transcriptional regulator C-terminal domain-containing protein n=1 Tax=Sphingomonas natans TaxID=3063330 RepID=A0ABT8Y9E1_9SPHN|nr:IclR family transcriptional regulator C-terminal domain-containing protein [Sphingomonas sp. BIUV-7]MDO6414952.1 IclR family transcriptional regulator C-terminal domain-containing protein [Sphingomonas sp. BIUV-7]